MRQMDHDQDSNGLGAPIKRPEMPKPHKKIAEGVWQSPDGKMHTNIPEPPPQNIWDAYQRAISEKKP